MLSTPSNFSLGYTWYLGEPSFEDPYNVVQLSVDQNQVELSISLMYEDLIMTVTTHRVYIDGRSGYKSEAYTNFSKSFQSNLHKDKLCQALQKHIELNYQSKKVCCSMDLNKPLPKEVVQIVQVGLN